MTLTGRLRGWTSWRPSVDRSYLFVLIVLLGLLLVTALGPLQSLLAATARVDALEFRRDRLRQEVTTLDARRQQLSDPDELELIARKEFNLVKPGEVPFIVVAPEAEFALDQVSPPPPSARPWYARIGEAVQRLLT